MTNDYKSHTKQSGYILANFYWWDIINLFSFTLQDNISEWGENFVQDHLNYTFDELEQAVYKHFRTMKNDEEVYMQLRNFQQVCKWVEVYYERLFKMIIVYKWKLLMFSLLTYLEQVYNHTLDWQVQVW
jgi:hypothetical protein